MDALRNELSRRRSKNPGYSLRAFAKSLQMSPAQLSQVISGKRPLTAKAAIRIADRLNYSPLERAALVESTVRGIEPHLTVAPKELQEEEFQLMSNWVHFAILSLSELKQHRADPRWIAAQIGVRVQEAAQSLERLRKLGIIEVSGGKMRQVIRPIRTTTDVPSAAIRLYHSLNLEKAKEALSEVAVEDREFSAITAAISRKKIPQAKKAITEFKRKLAELLENGEKDAVYTFSVQLFPLSKLEKK